MKNMLLFLFTMTASGSAMAYPCQGWHYEYDYNCHRGALAYPDCPVPRVVWEKDAVCRPGGFAIPVCECSGRHGRYRQPDRYQQPDSGPGYGLQEE